MKKYLISKLSDTQRLVSEPVEVNGEKRVEIRKEWRSSRSQVWMSAKAVTVPYKDIPAIIEILAGLISDTVNQKYILEE